MRIAVLGCGSIGQRHLRNLLAIGQSDIVAYDPALEIREEVLNLYKVAACETLEDVWGQEPDVAFITSPSHLHLEHSCLAAHHGCHLFIEKPMSDRLEGLDDLLAIVQEEHLVTMVGYNTRFHHGPSSVKRLIENGAIGKVISGALEAGQYLPDWQPGRDYRKRYSAHRSMGGGVLLDGAQEFDFARWLFGEVTEVYCLGGKMSSLELDTEDSVNLLMKFDSGMSASLHLDYIQRVYAKTCKVIGEEGTIHWDMTSPWQVRWYSANTNAWTDIPAPDDYSVNDMYIEEVRHFLSCLEDRRDTGMSVVEGVQLTRVLLGARESMETGRPSRIETPDDRAS